MVLVLVILIIAAIIGTAAVFGDLIIRDIMQSRLIDQSIQAYYLAESGSEKALYQVRRWEGIINCPSCPGINCCEPTGYCPAPDNSIPCVNQDQGGLRVKGGWQTNVTNEQETAILMKRGESFQIDLFNPYQAADSNINKVEINSSVDSLTLYGEFTNLTKVLEIGGNNCGYQPPVFKDFIYLAPPPVKIGGLSGITMLGECSYTFRLNYPLNPNLNVYDSSIITLTVYNETGPGNDIQKEIPSRVVIDSQAVFGNSLQKLRVKTPMRPPLSGLYDFVLFSEQEIVK